MKPELQGDMELLNGVSRAMEGLRLFVIFMPGLDGAGPV